MVSLDPEISILLWVWVSSEAPSGSGCPATSSNVLKKKWKTLNIQNGSKIELVIRLFFEIMFDSGQLGRGRPPPRCGSASAQVLRGTVAGLGGVKGASEAQGKRIEVKTGGQTWINFFYVLKDTFFIRASAQMEGFQWNVEFEYEKKKEISNFPLRNSQSDFSFFSDSHR